MNKFGQVKSKLVSKLTDLYTKENKEDIKNILSLIKENKNFVETYLLYEEIENKYFSDEQVARFYVEELSKSLNGKSKELKKQIQKIDKSIGLIETKYIPVYDYLDSLLENDSLLNIEKKVRSKIDLVNYLTTKKEIVESKETIFTDNQKLLYSVLANNFNVLYSNSLNEEQKEKLKSILSLSDEDLKNQTKELKESITNQVDKILSESSENELKDKLKEVKKEVQKTEPTRYGLFKLKELQNGLS